MLPEHVFTTIITEYNNRNPMLKMFFQNNGFKPSEYHCHVAEAVFLDDNGGLIVDGQPFSDDDKAANWGLILDSVKRVHLAIDPNGYLALRDGEEVPALVLSDENYNPSPGSFLAHLKACLPLSREDAVSVCFVEGEAGQIVAKMSSNVMESLQADEGQSDIYFIIDRHNGVHPIKLAGDHVALVDPERFAFFQSIRGDILADEYKRIISNLINAHYGITIEDTLMANESSVLDAIDTQLLPCEVVMREANKFDWDRVDGVAWSVGISEQNRARNQSHYFTSTPEAYELAYENPRINQGDTLCIESESVVALVWKYPIAVTKNSGSLYCVNEDYVTIIGDAGWTNAQIEYAVSEAQNLGCELAPWVVSFLQEFGNGYTDIISSPSSGIRLGL